MTRPISGMLSVVNEKSPLNALVELGVARSTGSSSCVSSQAGAKSASVNASTDGMTSAASTERMSSAVDGHRAVAVPADAEPVEALPEVQVGVLVAQDRPDSLLLLPGQRGHRAGPGELVGERGQRERQAGHPRDLRPPDAGAADHDVGRDVTVLAPRRVGDGTRR